MLSIYQCDGTLYKNFMVEILHNFEKGTAKQIKFRVKGDYLPATKKNLQPHGTLTKENTPESQARWRKTGHMWEAGRTPIQMLKFCLRNLASLHSFSFLMLLKHPNILTMKFCPSSSNPFLSRGKPNLIVQLRSTSGKQLLGTWITVPSRALRNWVCTEICCEKQLRGKRFRTHCYSAFPTWLRKSV